MIVLCFIDSQKLDFILARNLFALTRRQNPNGPPKSSSDFVLTETWQTTHRYLILARFLIGLMHCSELFESHGASCREHNQQTWKKQWLCVHLGEEWDKSNWIWIWKYNSTLAGRMIEKRTNSKGCGLCLSFMEFQKPTRSFKNVPTRNHYHSQNHCWSSLLTRPCSGDRLTHPLGWCQISKSVTIKISPTDFVTFLNPLRVTFLLTGASLETEEVCSHPAEVFFLERGTFESMQIAAPRGATSKFFRVLETRQFPVEMVCDWSQSRFWSRTMKHIWVTNKKRTVQIFKARDDEN